MADHRTERQSELQGGLKATTRAQGRGEPKIGVEEFMSVAERFGFSPATLAKIRAAVEAAGALDETITSEVPEVEG